MLASSYELNSSPAPAQQGSQHRLVGFDALGVPASLRARVRPVMSPRSQSGHISPLPSPLLARSLDTRTQDEQASSSTTSFYWAEGQTTSKTEEKKKGVGGQSRFVPPPSDAVLPFASWSSIYINRMTHCCFPLLSRPTCILMYLLNVCFVSTVTPAIVAPAPPPAHRPTTGKSKKTNHRQSRPKKKKKKLAQIPLEQSGTSVVGGGRGASSQASNRLYTRIIHTGSDTEDSQSRRRVFIPLVKAGVRVKWSAKAADTKRSDKAAASICRG